MRNRSAVITMALLQTVLGCRDATVRDTPPATAPVTSAGNAPREVTRTSVVSPNPLLSKGKRAVAFSPVPFSEARYAVDGDRATSWCAGKPTPDRPAWLALDVGRGPTRVLVGWSAAGSFNYNETDYGSPGAYRLETSADSTNGSDGTWTVAVNVPSVGTHAAAHAVPFAGQRWVRLVVTAAPGVSPNGVQIDEVTVHDASGGVTDAWFFMGDSITALAFGRGPTGLIGFSERVHVRHPRFSPTMINGGIGDDKSSDGARRVDDWLALNPEARYWGLAYGTNDAAGDANDTTDFRRHLGTLVDRLLEAGKVPILATIPFASDDHHRQIPLFNAVIDDLRRTRALPSGPDLYAWFLAHPEQLRDGVHPDDRGVDSINRLWAEAVDSLYRP